MQEELTIMVSVKSRSRVGYIILSLEMQNV